MSGPARIVAELLGELDTAEGRAWQSLSRYKFQMFGYWAAIWVHLNRIGGFRRPNPWADLVLLARQDRPDGAVPTAPLFGTAGGQPHQEET